MFEDCQQKIKMKPKTGLIIVLILIVVPLLFFGLKGEDRVCFEENCFFVEIADSTPERALGLMFKTIEDNEGMLFTFSNEDIYEFWMKNTKAPLDIIWISSNKEIVYISENAQPCDLDCEIIRPDNQARYVLEINGGLVESLEIEVGDPVKILI